MTLICQHCYSRHSGVCQSVTCVRNRQAEAERNSVRGTCGKASSREEPDKQPMYYSPPIQTVGRGENIRIVRPDHAK